MERIVGLWRNMTKPEALALAPQIEDWFQARGWTVLTEWEDITRSKPDFLISLGGDGTLLQAAREASSYKIPVLGVNFGRLGFLCEIEREEVFRALEQILREDFEIQERLMLSAVIKQDGQDNISQLVLNDVVFSREGREGLITLQANLSGEPTVSYPADGLIVSTPTGSTAYSLSAGGPIISPNVQAILLTPLAAHSLSARPMLVSDEEEIQILLANGEKCMVTFDGRQSIVLHAGQTVIIKTAPIKALLIRLGARSFPQVVREKLRDRWHE
ncbi:NAD(+)/NADH kinase [Desulfosporosinus sp.]|uniref:NAD(+)/NADH kinase n=1 Tax=Desulfosporosinus sp. TaxID=157907 RepID=UPI000E832473|nr:NAD(+)/NADH kinase [Desulfosporosinus sp.]MBC2722377.1 NAD(+)/NADH kinase [Desulfosporosinus sp.]MBC2726849.1 NAD(+)/NADH kinase [Desulfosporosinus sp.]HBV89075.1 NAD+ kinase [Desulfosporosinus sp.]